jgi:hypothetical protein
MFNVIWWYGELFDDEQQEEEEQNPGRPWWRKEKKAGSEIEKFGFRLCSGCDICLLPVLCRPRHDTRVLFGELSFASTPASRNQPCPTLVIMRLSLL